MQSQHLKGWDDIPDAPAVERAVSALRSRGFKAELVPDARGALERIGALVPDGAEVMTGSSRTLDEIGFTALLASGEHRWLNLKKGIVEEKDGGRQLELRRKAVFADYFLGSVHAVTEGGELVAGSATGSQVASYAYGGANLILVAGTQKVVPDLGAAFDRLRSHVVPLEDQRMKSAGFPGTLLSKIFVYEREAKRNVHVVLVNQKLGF